MPLNRRQESFCRLYAAAPTGAAAARDAGYSEDNAANQAARLLKRADIAARIDELGGPSDNLSAQAEDRARVARGLVAQIKPVYDAALKDGDHDSVLQAVEMQARMWGLVTGAAIVKPRGLRPAPASDEDDAEETPADHNDEVIQSLQDRFRKFEACLVRIADFLEDDSQEDLLHRFDRHGRLMPHWAEDAWDFDWLDEHEPLDGPPGGKDGPENDDKFT